MTVARLSDKAQVANLVAITKSWIGTPYRHQASLKHIGCDCLGLVRGIWRELYQQEPEATPPYSPDWAEAGCKEQLFEAAGRHMKALPVGQGKAGELLIFRWRAHLPAKHLAITTSSNTMVHAQQGAAVCEVAINGWWRRHIAYRFVFPSVCNDNPKGKI